MTEFINTYSFFPLKDKPNRSSIKFTGENTGYIEYSLLTKTPLFIPNTSNSDIEKDEHSKNEHKKFAFYSYEKLTKELNFGNLKKVKPIIPGSEIRGMFRSYYEMLTNSCLSHMSKDKLLSSRIAVPFKPGLLEHTNEGYKLFDVIDCVCDFNNENFKKLELKEFECFNIEYKECKDKNKRKFNVVVSINGNSVNDGPIIGKGKAYFIKGAESFKKRNYHFFIKNKEVKTITEDELNILKKVIEVYKNNYPKTNKEKRKSPYNEYSDKLEDFRNLKDNQDSISYIPVYYLFDKEYDKEFACLSMSCITREIYRNKISDLIGPYVNDNCNLKDICPACSLFGTVNKKESISVASSIRFIDLSPVLSENENFSDLYMEKEVILKPLGEPKETSYEFYLKKPDNAKYWTPDYYVDNNGKVIKYKATINGRKFYWHWNNQKPEDYKDDKPSGLNCTIMPVNRGVMFKGKIYFDNLSNDKLNELIYLVNCGQNEKDIKDVKNGYKLGKAKPYGFGSVATKVDKVVLRKINISNNNIEFKENENYVYNEPVFENKDFVEYFRAMTCFNNNKSDDKTKISYPIPYPYNNKGKPRTNNGIFNWFVDNRKRFASSRCDLEYNQHLEPLKYEKLKDKI